MVCAETYLYHTVRVDYLYDVPCTYSRFRQNVHILAHNCCHILAYQVQYSTRIHTSTGYYGPIASTAIDF